MLRTCSLWLFAVLACAAPAAGQEPREVRGSANVACRLYIQGEDGKFYFARSADPAGTAVIYDRHRPDRGIEQHTTLSAHPFVVYLPPGKYTFAAEHGKEHTVAEQTIDVKPYGDAPEVRLELRRWNDMPRLGWFSGDTHVHRTLEELPNVIEAEDLHVALPLTYWVRGAYESPAAAARDKHPEPKPIVVSSTAAGVESLIQRIIWPINTEYELFTVKGQAHTQGAVFVLNHKRPLTAAAPPVAPVALAAREQGALLDLDKHTWNWSLMIVPQMQVDLFELANNHIWRTDFSFTTWTRDVLPQDWDIETEGDGYTERGWIDWGFKTYYALLNCGFRLRPSGGTASGVHPVPLGFGRVYVECPNGFSYENWMEGLNLGRSFVTTGPLLRVQFDGEPPGTVFPSAQAHAVRVTGVAESLTPLMRIEIIVNGEVAQTIEPANEGLSAESPHGYSTKFDATVAVEHSSWVAVRCFAETPPAVGQATEPAESKRFRYAHTAPAHWEIDGPVRSQAREVNYFIQRMEQEIARNRGVLAPAEVAEYEQALEIYRRISARARP